MFSISSSRSVWDRLEVPLKAMCSRKWATPLLRSVSYRDPASIHRPTVAVAAPLFSVATRSPLLMVLTLVAGTFSRAVLNSAEESALPRLVNWKGRGKKVSSDYNNKSI